MFESTRRLLYGGAGTAMGQGQYSWPVTAPAPIMEIRPGRLGPQETVAEPIVAVLQTRPPQCPRGQFWDGRRCRGSVASIPFMPFALIPVAAAGAGTGAGVAVVRER